MHNATAGTAGNADHLRRQVCRAVFETSLPLACGSALPGFEIAYETYGTLSPERDNAILVCHGMTSNQHAAGCDASNRAGWWDIAIGPGRMLDTERWFIVCSNVLGGSAGSTSPRSINPATGLVWGMRFPILTIGDMVDAQVALTGRLGISRWHAVIGGCMGGFQVYDWTIRYPKLLKTAIAIGATPATSAYTIALWEVMRQAIYADPAFAGGDYADDAPPLSGLGMASMIGSVLWLDRDTLAAKFGRATVTHDGAIGRSFAPEFAVERFLADVRTNSRKRFDATSLIYMTKAIDQFDITSSHPSLASAVALIRARMLLVSYASDWRHPASSIAALAHTMREVGVTAEHVALDSRFGHGAFQFDVSALAPVVANFLAASALCEIQQ